MLKKSKDLIVLGGGARTLSPIISQLLFGIGQLKKQFFPRGDVK